MKLIARLLHGGGAGMGVKTKVFLVKDRWFRHACIAGGKLRPDDGRPRSVDVPRIVGYESLPGRTLRHVASKIVCSR
ncbi:MAG: hypothetical protein WDO15_17475 [Bacteroidota bacterium]